MTLPARGAEPGRDVSATTASATLHASCICWQGRGVLLAGPSGSGKSDLALRLIDAGAVLVADDLVALSRRGSRLEARPVALAGLLEIRGQGIYRLPSLPESTLDLYVALGDADDTQRLPPERMSHTLLDVALPMIALDARRPSAVARIRMALHGTRVH